MDARWTLSELVAEVATRIAALPAPKNGQVRAVPDERTVRYYGTIGLLDRPGAMRGRTALYGEKHVAQVVAIKRLQTMGRSLSEIHALWPSLDDATLARMSGVAFVPPAKPNSRAFWKRTPAPSDEAGHAAFTVKEEPMPMLMPPMPMLPTPHAPVVPTGPTLPPPIAPPMPAAMPTFDAGPPVLGVVSPAVAPAGGDAAELRIQLAPNIVLTVALSDEHVAISPADVRALRAAAAPLLNELAARRLASQASGDPS